MKISDLLSMAVKNLTRRKFRTMMTVMGVVIGTAAIISMISLGIGINQSTSDFISSWGDLYTIEVYAGATDVSLTDETIQEILAMDGVEAASPFMQMNIYGEIRAGRNGRYTADAWSIIGAYPEALEKLGYHTEEGSLLQGNRRPIQLMAGKEASYLFRDSKRKGDDAMRYPLEDEHGVIPKPFFDVSKEDNIEIVLKEYSDEGDDKEFPYPVEIVGVVTAEGQDARTTQQNLYMDIRDMSRLSEEYKRATKSKDRTPFTFDHVLVKVDDLDKVPSVVQQLEQMRFSTWSMEKERQNAMQQTQLIQLILGSLGGISLFVAAISIANTMVMSVYERTREIGIMKVLGCFVRDIRTTFLVEAAMIGVVGGTLGVLLSYLISFLLNRFGGSLGSALGMMNFGEMGATVSIIPPWLVLLGLGFSTGVGIISGIYPAYRAVRISALEAIKQE